jgi:hypothetical protein
LSSSGLSFTPINNPEKNTGDYETDSHCNIGVEMERKLEKGDDDNRCKGKDEGQNNPGIHIHLHAIFFLL